MSENVEPFLRTEENYNYHYFNGKIKSERVISKLPNYCIVRPGSIYGVDSFGKIDNRSLALKKHVDSGKKYIRADNIEFSIIDVKELADAIIELATNVMLELSMSQRKNRYRIMHLTRLFVGNMAGMINVL